MDFFVGRATACVFACVAAWWLVCAEAHGDVDIVRETARVCAADPVCRARYGSVEAADLVGVVARMIASHGLDQRALATVGAALGGNDAALHALVMSLHQTCESPTATVERLASFQHTGAMLLILVMIVATQIGIFIFGNASHDST